MAVVASVAHALAEWGVSLILRVHLRPRLTTALWIAWAESVVRMAAPPNVVCVLGAPPVGRLVSARGAFHSVQAESAALMDAAGAAAVVLRGRHASRGSVRPLPVNHGVQGWPVALMGVVGSAVSAPPGCLASQVNALSRTTRPLARPRPSGHPARPVRGVGVASVRPTPPLCCSP